MLSFAPFLLLAPSLTSRSTALPAADLAKREDYYVVWTVSNYSRGCSPGGCVYSFNISAPAIANDTATAFITSCTGPISEDYENYQADTKCDNPDVRWKLDIMEGVNRLFVTHAYESPRTSTTPCIHNYTGTQALDKQQLGTFKIVDVFSYHTC